MRLALTATALAAAPAAARTVDYGHSDAEFEAAAVAIGAPTPAATPPRGESDVVLEGAEKLDHELLILGISCRAWQVDNPLSQMVRRALSGWDRDGALEPVAERPLLRLRIGSAGSDLRCIQIRELQERCIVRTRIEGEAILERPGQAPRSERIAIEDQQVHTRPGACGSLSRGAGLSGRAVSLTLIERLRAVASTD